MMAFFIPIYNSTRLEVFELPSQKPHYCSTCNEARYFTFRLYKSIEKTFGVIPSGTASIVTGKCSVCGVEFECDKETSRIVRGEIERLVKERKMLKRYRMDSGGGHGLEKV